MSHANEREIRVIEQSDWLKVKAKSTKWQLISGNTKGIKEWYEVFTQGIKFVYSFID